MQIVFLFYDGMTAQVAQFLQLGIEYDPDSLFDAGSSQKGDPRIRDILSNRIRTSFEGVNRSC